MFTRSPNNPILRPDPKNDWESRKVYNCGVIFENDDYHVFYRAMGTDWVSSIGYAVSKDGESFERSDYPMIISPDKTFSIEDPRVAKIGDDYFLSHTRYDGLNVTLNLATSKDLKHWKLHGEMIPKWDFKKANGFVVGWDPAQMKAEKDSQASRKWGKAGGIFSEKINGKYWMLFGDRNIWLAFSDDGLTWEPVWEPFIRPRGRNYFDQEHVEMGPPPIKTERGWLVLYHGVTEKIEYKIGFLLLDLNNPAKIIFRSDIPIFEPCELYELSGIVDILPGGYDAMKKMTKIELDAFIKEAETKGTMPKIIFSCGAVLVDEILRIYYGASDSTICTATANINDVLALAK